MAACLGGGLFDGGALDSMRLIVLSGTAIPEAVARAVDAKMPDGAVTQLWGMTETQAGLYSRPGDAIDIAARSAGRPSPGTEVRVTCADGRPLGVGEEGELEVRGPLLFPGLFQQRGGKRPGVYRGRLVSERRSSDHRRRRQRRDHRPHQGNHRPGRCEI